MGDVYDWERIHDQILQETFPVLSDRQAVALLGILNDFRIELSSALKDDVEPVEGRRPELERPLLLTPAAELIGRVFGFVVDDLIATYRDSWQDLRQQPETEEIVRQLESHRFVDRLVPVSDVP